MVMISGKLAVAFVFYHVFHCGLEMNSYPLNHLMAPQLNNGTCLDVGNQFYRN